MVALDGDNGGYFDVYCKSLKDFSPCFFDGFDFGCEDLIVLSSRYSVTVVKDIAMLFARPLPSSEPLFCHCFHVFFVDDL